MRQKLFKIINIILCICLTISGYLLIINLCNQKVFRTNNINEKLNSASFLSIINSKELDNNKNVIKVRNHLDAVYLLTNKFNIKEKDINKIIDSDISKGIFTKVSINVLNYIKTGDDIQLFSLNDLDMVIDENLDSGLERNKIDLNFIRKKLLAKTLKEVGKKILDDIPNTSSSISSISKFKLNILKLVYSDKSKDILYLVTLIFLILLVIFNSKELLFNSLKYCLFGISTFLIMTILYLKLLVIDYGKEWDFLKRLISELNKNILICSIVLIFIMSIIVISNKIKRKV